MAAPEGNKFAIGNSGRSKQWETKEELQKDIEKYFNECDSREVQVYVKSAQEIQDIKKPIPYTIEGLCEVLECDRLTLINYEKKKGYEEFFNTIKGAKLKIQRNKMERGLEGESPAAFAIFDLVNNTTYENTQKISNINTNFNHDATPTKEEAKKISEDLENDC